MTVTEAIEIVVELAEAEMLSLAEANENGLQAERERQLEAIRIVTNLGGV